MMQQKKKIKIINCHFRNDSTDKFIFESKKARKAIKKNQTVVAFVTTEEGKVIRTSPIVSMSDKQIETKNSFYVFA